MVSKVNLKLKLQKSRTLYNRGNVSYALFLNNAAVESVDLSDNDLTGAFGIFAKLTRLTTLVLRNCSLLQLSQLSWANPKSVLKLDFSSNGLVRVDYDSLKTLTSLEYLDLSSNRIVTFDSRLFENREVINSLKHLNLAYNLIVSLDMVLFNMVNLQTLNIGTSMRNVLTNRLKFLSNFEFDSNLLI